MPVQCVLVREPFGMTDEVVNLGHDAWLAGMEFGEQADSAQQICDELAWSQRIGPHGLALLLQPQRSEEGEFCFGEGGRVGGRVGGRCKRDLGRVCCKLRIALLPNPGPGVYAHLFSVICLLDVDVFERAARARARYNAAMQALAERTQQSTAPDLLLEARQTVHVLVARVPVGGADAMLQSLDAYAGELARARLRTAEMVSHALDAAQLEDLRERLLSARPGQAVDCSELRQAEGVVAWSLVCAPSDADEGVIA